MNCLFLIFPFAYLYTRQNFCASRIWNLLITLSRFKIFSFRFVHLLGFCCPDLNNSAYILWTKITALVTRSDFIYIFCQHSRNGKIAANSFGSFLQPTKNLARYKFMFFVKFSFVCNPVPIVPVWPSVLRQTTKNLHNVGLCYSPPRSSKMFCVLLEISDMYCVTYTHP